MAEIEPTAGTRTCVWVSMDTPSADPAMPGVSNSGILYNNGFTVSNLHVESNSPLITPGDFAGAVGVLEFWPATTTRTAAGIVTGTDLATGNIETWQSNYGQSNDIGIPGASPVGNNTGFDFGDGGSNTSLGYGSFQIHNYRALETPLAYNNWRGARDLRIGNRDASGQAPDWTIANHSGTCPWRRLAILVHETTPRLLDRGTPCDTTAAILVHETTPRLLDADNSLIKTDSGTLILNGDNTYNGTTEVRDGILLVNGHTSGQGSFTVFSGARLGGSGSIGLAPRRGGDGSGRRQPLARQQRRHPQRRRRPGAR